MYIKCTLRGRERHIPSNVGLLKRRLYNNAYMLWIINTLSNDEVSKIERQKEIMVSIFN